MALTKLERRRAPLDGSWFQTTANLNSVLTGIREDRNECGWPALINEVRVPIWISMRLYKAQETKEVPDGMIHGPVVKIGTLDSPEIEMFGMHWRAGLCCDWRLDASLNCVTKWLYFPFGYGRLNAPGEDVSVYRCDKCGEQLYRDDQGRRRDLSACIFRGGLVCRDCEVTGLVYDEETADQLIRARDLADRVGEKARLGLERNIQSLSRGFSWGRPSQTRLFREDKYSFAWSTVIFGEDGTKTRGINGGLIQHGPTPDKGAIDNQYIFHTYDYAAKCVRNATEEEINDIHWSIHT